MADPLSITASIIAVASASFSIAKGLCKVADALGSTGQEIHMYSREIDDFARLLKNVQWVMDSASGGSPDEGTLVQDVLDICHRVLDPINRLQKSLNRFLASFQHNRSKLHHFGLLARWYFRERRELLFFRGALQSQHRVLNTILELMVLRSQLATPSTVDARRVYQDALETAMQTLSRHINGPSLNTLGIYNPIEDPSMHNTLSSSTQNTRVAHKESPAAGENAESWLSPSSVSDQLRISDDPEREEQLYAGPSNSAITRLESISSGAGLSEEEVRDVEHQIDNDLESNSSAYAMELWEDIRALARRTLRYAEKTLRSSRQNRSSTDVSVPKAAPASALSNQSNKPSTPPLDQSAAVGDIYLLDSDEVEYCIPKDCIQTVEELRKFLTLCCVRRVNDIKEGRYHILDSKGAVIPAAGWGQILIRSNFTHAVLIFGDPSMPGPQLRESYRSLTDPKFKEELRMQRQKAWKRAKEAAVMTQYNRDTQSMLDQQAQAEKRKGDPAYMMYWSVRWNKHTWDDYDKILDNLYLLEMTRDENEAKHCAGCPNQIHGAS